MKRNYLFLALAACLLASCGNSSRQNVENIAIADVAAAMDNLAPLKLSELGSTVRYVPLQTTDSCLIGDKPTLAVAGDYILVHSRNDCFAFDKQTGRFVAAIGHYGEDPQAYSNAYPYYNEHDGLVYFVRYPDKLQQYDLAGRYVGQVVVPTPPAIPSSFAFADTAVVGYYSNIAQQGSNGRSLLLFSGQGTVLDTVPAILPPLPPMQTNDITVISITYMGLASMAYTRFQDGTALGQPDRLPHVVGVRRRNTLQGAVHRHCLCPEGPPAAARPRLPYRQVAPWGRSTPGSFGHQRQAAARHRAGNAGKGVLPMCPGHL